MELLGGMAAFVKPGHRVVVKPNISFPNPPESATTTHPEVVRELAVMCREAGASRIMILDHTLHNPTACLEQSGVVAACASVAPGMVRALNDSRFYRQTDIPLGVAMKSTRVMIDVLDADVLISAPVAKSHSSAGPFAATSVPWGPLWTRPDGARAGESAPAPSGRTRRPPGRDASSI